MYFSAPNYWGSLYEQAALLDFPARTPLPAQDLDPGFAGMTEKAVFQRSAKSLRVASLGIDGSCQIDRLFFWQTRVEAYLVRALQKAHGTQ